MLLFIFFVHIVMNSWFMKKGSLRQLSFRPFTKAHVMDNETDVVWLRNIEEHINYEIIFHILLYSKIRHNALKKSYGSCGTSGKARKTWGVITFPFYHAILNWSSCSQAFSKLSLVSKVTSFALTQQPLVQGALLLCPGFWAPASLVSPLGSAHARCLRLAATSSLWQLSDHARAALVALARLSVSCGADKLDQAAK